MKRFIRTVAGKTLLFIICSVAVCVFAASIAGGFILLESGAGFYTKTEPEITEEIVTDTMRGSGYNCAWTAVFGDGDYDDGNRYYITDGNGKVLYRSYGVTAESDWDITLTYGVDRETRELNYLFGDGPIPSELETVTVRLTVPDSSADGQKIALIRRAVHAAYALRYSVWVIGAASLLAALLSFIALMSAAGRRPDTEELVPGPLNPVPFDLLLGGCIFFAVLAIFLTDELVDSGAYLGGGMIVLAVLIAAASLPAALGLCMSAAVRIKQHTLLRKSLIGRLLVLVWRFLCWAGRKLHAFCIWVLKLIRNIPLIWKTAAVTVGLTILELLFCALRRPDALLIERLILVPLILWFALSLRRLQKAGAALAGGDLSYQTDTKGMFADLKKHGENLNSIAGGMAIAVEERLKSERMKTELITNVSHDIKTPLTSIINYASLIAEEPTENGKITEYSEVLVRQSEKLKRLIEDLVEASKASTGNLDVMLAPCDASVFISQAAGEYEEKMKKASLTLITKQPEKEVRILADGRRMWRIFDNLMNNICKYAMADTRVYLSLEEQQGNAVITFKNTSRDELDMSEEELTERFSRGDASRNTEGNGLGLAIAKSMAELQGGTLHLTADGDLFKATLTFPLIG